MAQLSEVASGLLGRALKPWQVDYLDGVTHDSICATQDGQPCNCPMAAFKKDQTPSHLTRDMAHRLKALVWIEQCQAKQGKSKPSSLHARRLAAVAVLLLGLLTTSCQTIPMSKTHLEFNDYGQVVEVPGVAE